MRDVGGEDMAIQFNEFEEVRAWGGCDSSGGGRENSRDQRHSEAGGPYPLSLFATTLPRPYPQLVARCAQQGEARASRAMFTGVGGKERRGSRASVTPSQASDVEDEEDEEDDDDEEGEDPNMTPAQIKAKALFLLVAGVGLVTFFR